MRLMPHLRHLSLAGLLLATLAPSAPAQERESNALRPQARSDQQWWMQLHQKFLDRAKQGDIDLLFLGDSITQGWGSAPKVWDRYYGPRKPANFGIGGDQTGHVLWRLDHGEVDGIRPRVTVLMIGTNNLGTDSPEQIADGIKAVVHSLRTKLPETEILLLGVFPRGQKPGPGREQIKTINAEISKLDDGKHVKYLDIAPAFLEPDDTLSPTIMPDFLHLSRQGYRRWADAIEPSLWTMMDEK